MSKEDTARFFDEKTSKKYDENFKRMGQIMDNLHLLIDFTLENLPQNARILCVGVGTGSEIISLAETHKDWHFTGVEPSGPMLDVCREKLQQRGLEKRCELFNGYLSDFKNEDQFDAVICLLVTHFIKDKNERQNLFNDMTNRLNPDGYLITADISFDTQSPQYPAILEQWKTLHRKSGAPKEQQPNIEQILKDHVAVLPPTSVEQFFKESGLPLPVQFFQSLLIHAWYAQKPTS